MCGDELGKQYKSFNDAVTSCNANRLCGGFYKYREKDEEFKACRGSKLNPIHTSKGSIMYRKCK